MNLKQFELLCIKELTGNCNDIELELFREEIKDSDEKKIRYEKIKELWNYAQPLSIESERQPDNNWNFINDKIKMIENYKDKSTGANKLTKETRNSWLAPKWKPAVASTFIVLLFLAVTFLYRQDDKQIWRNIQTGNKEKKEVTFSDGSIAIINNGSIVKYPEQFSDSREVILTGEAFFSVVKDSRPFIVKTSNAETKVLGTKFNVWSRGVETRVIVEEGKVNLKSSISNADGVNIVKDQRCMVVGYELPLSPESVNAERLTSWIKGKIVFERTRLGEIISELERYYDVDILLADSSLSGKSLTGTFDEIDFESVLQIICLSLDIEYEQKDNRFIITNKNVYK